MSGRLKLKSIYPTFEEFSTFCMDTITEFYPRLVTDMPNSVTLKSEIERYVFKPLYRQFKNATCRYLPTEEGIDAFNNQFSNQLEEVVFDFLIYTSTNLDYFNESYTKVGENLEQAVTTYNSPINQAITNTKSNTTIAKGATAQNINLMVYNGNTSWLKAFSSYYTPQRKAELIDKFRWLFISFYVGSDEGVILVEVSKDLSMADGDMVITPEENEILRKVIIEKPEKLIPENIRDGVNIGGVEGSLVEGLIPSGILEITKNGLYNVADKEGVNVNVVAELAVDNGMIYEGKYRVRYFDIDGAILKIEYVEDGGKLTPPAKTPNYEPDYLIFDEWNYDIENYVVEQPTDVGATYKTVDDATYMFCRIISTYPTININISRFISIDWGDGTIDTSTSHTYTQAGNYIIKIEGAEEFNVAQNSYIFGNEMKSQSLYKCYLSSKITNISYVFRYSGIEIISLPKNLTTIGGRTFEFTRKLKHVTLPKGLTNIGEHLFDYCNSLRTILIPQNINIIPSYLAYNSSIETIIIPLGTVELSKEALANSESLKDIIISKSVQSIGNYAMNYTSTLTNLFINSVASLQRYSIHNSNANRIYWVKDDIIEDLKVTTNWSDSSSRMMPQSWYPNLTNQNE